MPSQTEMTKHCALTGGYVLNQVHDVATKAFTREKNADAWRADLSTDDYIMREHVLGLSQMANSDQHELMVFIMSSEEEPDVPLCSCELLVRKAFRYVSRENNEVERKSVLCGCVGAVFTYKEFRGRGLALVMTDLLVQTARTPELLGEDGFLFLYSEVGEYYSRNGFKSFPVKLAKYPLSSRPAPYQKPSNVELIEFHQFGEVFDAYHKQFDSQMRENVASDGIERVSVAASEEYVDWFHLRSKFLALKFFDENLGSWNFANETLDSLATKFADTHPKVYGLRINSPETDALQGFIVWTYDYEYSPEEKIYRVHVTVIKNFVASGNDYGKTTQDLFTYMNEYLEAHHEEEEMANLQEVKVWESDIPPSFVEYMKKNLSAKTGIENPSRSALMMNNKVDDRKVKEGKIIWEENTKLPWF